MTNKIMGWRTHTPQSGWSAGAHQNPGLNLRNVEQELITLMAGGSPTSPASAALAGFGPNRSVLPKEASCLGRWTGRLREEDQE